ncbi:MAG: outer membrane protein assembly factor BamB [Pseudomonadales bacterium]|nr:outer membrane protein assembly factor BamB [Pseudomonadales bacterium]
MKNCFSRTNRILSTASLAVVLFLSACSSSKHKDLQPLELADFNTALKIETLWDRPIGSLGQYYHQFKLAVDAQYLYTASETGKVYQLDKMTGEKRWKVSLDVDLTAGVAIDDNNVYVGARDGAIIALSKENGEQVWSAKLSSEPVSAPSLYQEHLVVQLSNGQVYNLNTADGEVRWVFDGHVPALTIRGTGQAVFFGEFVAVGLANGKLAILDQTTGQLRWENKVGIAQGDTEIERIVDVDTQPSLLDNKLFAVSYQGRVVAYDLQTGRTIWAEDESSYKDLTTGFGSVYVTSDEAMITAYDQNNGEIKWINEDLLRRKLSSPTPVSSYLVIADYDGYLHVISQVDGKMVARTRVDVLARKCFCRNTRLSNVWRLINKSSGVRSAILADGNRFYAVANNGKLKAYKIGDSIENADNLIKVPYRHFNKAPIKKRTSKKITE